MMAGPRVWSVILLSSVLCLCRAYEVVNSTEIKAETNSGLKNYEEEEDGKVLPYRYSGHVETHKLTCDFRTFLTTVEIVVICVVTVVLVILLSLLSRSYPFFRSPDDMTALAELISLFGSREVQAAAKK